MKKISLVALYIVLLLSGCEYLNDPPSANSSDHVALMRVAVPGWQADGPLSVRQIASPTELSKTVAASPRAISSYSLAPGIVIRLAEDKIVLVVVGTPSNEEGNALADHASTAMLGAYWFMKREGQWVKVAEQPGFAEEGFHGHPGELRQIDLGAGNIALAVENGSCWQGYCGKWLTFYAFGENRVTKVFGDLISSDSLNAMNRCSELVELADKEQLRVALDDYSSSLGCYSIDGRARILPSTDGPGQLVMEFSGTRTSEEIVPIEIPVATHDGFENDDPTEEFLVTAEAVQQKQVYRFSNGRYILIEGKNPNPPL